MEHKKITRLGIAAIFQLFERKGLQFGAIYFSWEFKYYFEKLGLQHKKKDGIAYKENVIKHMFNTTAKLVQEKYFNEWNIKINPFTDPCFKAARDARDATRRKLQTLPEKRMVRILNENTPDGLQKKFFF